MTAWAQPNPPRALPDVAARWARDRRTGAAANAFGVKTAAAAAGPPVATTTARSGRPEALIPAASPPALKPAGMAARRSTGGRSVEDAGTGCAEVAMVGMGAGPAIRSRGQRELFQARRLGQAVNEVERLDRLAGGALDQVVLDADGDDALGPLVVPNVHVDLVAAGHVLGGRWCGDHGHERLNPVGVGVERVELGLADRPRWPHVAGRQDAAGHRNEVGQEVDRSDARVGTTGQAPRCVDRRQFLFDLGNVSVAAQAVGLDALIDFTELELRLGFAAGARYAALRVDDEVSDQPVSDEGSERQQRGGGVAAGRPNDRHRRIDQGRQGRAVQLGESVDGTLEQVGPRVLEAIPARIVGPV